MKAISLWQPWASAIAVGSKRIETRSWRTSYCGPIAIHAAKKGGHNSIASLWPDLDIWWDAVFKLLGVDRDMKASERFDRILPFGAIVATANMTGYCGTEFVRDDVLDKDNGGFTERDLGDFTPGRFAWMLNDVRRLETPVPCVGRQGLFNVDDSILDQREATHGH